MGDGSAGNWRLAKGFGFDLAPRSPLPISGPAGGRVGIF
jgi:hypothetical protein